MSKTAGHKISKKFAAYPRLNPLGIGKNISAADLVDQVMLAYNGGRLREAAQLLAKKMLPEDGYIGMSLTGALTPAGLGKSCLIPLMKAGFVDWIISTGANLYHDLHFGLDMQLHSGSPFLDDVVLHRDGVIRIYDVLFDYNVLLDTDAFVREVIRGPEFQRPMGTDEFHYLLGKYVSERTRRLGLLGQRRYILDDTGFMIGIGNRHQHGLLRQDVSIRGGGDHAVGLQRNHIHGNLFAAQLLGGFPE